MIPEKQRQGMEYANEGYPEEYASERYSEEYAHERYPEEYPAMYREVLL